MKRAFALLSLTTLCTACGDDRDESPSPQPGNIPDGGTCATCDGACEETLALDSPVHIEGDILYSDTPPAGGPHNGCWAPYGFHEEPVRPENWVHNLEHGAIVLLYRCPEGCDLELGELRTFAEARSRVLVTPYAAMSGRFAAVSWGQRLVTTCLDLDAFAAFYDTRFNRGLENVGAGPPSGC